MILIFYRLFHLERTLHNIDLRRLPMLDNNFCNIKSIRNFSPQKPEPVASTLTNELSFS